MNLIKTKNLSILESIRSIPKEKISNAIEMLSVNWKDNKPELLKEGLFLSIIGILYAMNERELEPFSKGHLYIFKEVMSEIEEVYFNISNQLIDEETWFIECFDYSIKKVYHLDWKLYLSQILY